jgi:hypothetical protein
MCPHQPPARRFPDFLRPGFQPGALERIDSTVAVLDARAAILWTNPAWDDFARANGGAFQLDDYPTYLDAVAGPLRAYFADAFDHALSTGAVFEHDYDCSSAEVIRRYRMRVLPFPRHGMLVEHSQIATSDAPADGEPPLEERFLDEHGFIVQCSNCRRIKRPHARVPESWAWVPAWVTQNHPRTSHGLCAPCAAFYWRRGRSRP